MPTPNRIERAINLLQRAQHCEDTNQPNLAALYMRNAVAVIEA